jgi:ribosomal protein L16/L10AE
MGEVVLPDFNAKGTDIVGSDYVLGITESSDIDKGVLEAARVAYQSLIKRNREST